MDAGSALDTRLRQLPEPKLEGEMLAVWGKGLRVDAPTGVLMVELREAGDTAARDNGLGAYEFQWLGVHCGGHLGPSRGMRSFWELPGQAD
jgi:hypothetical protein